MKKYRVYSIFIAATLALLCVPSFAQAQNLTVDFEVTPLFSESNLVPGTSVSRYVDVTNSSGESKSVITETINTSCTGDPCLADVISVNISSDLGTHYEGTLSEFYDAGEVLLHEQGAGVTERYVYTLEFASSAGNEYQSSTTGFDLLIGFKGEEAVSDGGGGGSSGGSSGDYQGLLIQNETVVDIDLAETSVTITWTTNYSATSQVIYGSLSGAPYDLDLNAPNFGYPLASTEDASKVTNHSVVLTGLIPGETYVYRVVSHASPATVSREHTFTMPAILGESVSFAENNFRDSAGSLDYSARVSQNSVSGGVPSEDVTDGSSTSTATTSLLQEKENGKNLAAAGVFSTLFGSYLWVVGVLLLIILILLVLLMRKKEEE